jgi:uncharacterized protein YkwD
MLVLIPCLTLFLPQITIAAAEDSYDPKSFHEDQIMTEETDHSGGTQGEEPAAAEDSIDFLPWDRGAEPDFIIPDPGAQRLSFDSLAQLQSICADTYSSAAIAFCSLKSGEFVISKDLTVPSNLTVVFGVTALSENSFRTLDTPVRIPGGITVTLKGKLGVNDLTVDGRMIIENGAELSSYEGQCYLTVNGSIVNSGHISADGITGLNCIEQKSFSTSYIYVTQRCSSMDEMLNLLDYNDHHYDIHLYFNLYCSGYTDFSQDLTIPSDTRLILVNDGIIRAGCRLTVKGRLEVESIMSDVTLTIEGELKNEREVYLSNFGTGSRSRLKLLKGGSYTGKGWLMLSSSGSGEPDAADLLQGFDLSTFRQSKNGTFTQLELTDYEEPWEDGVISSFRELKEMADSGEKNIIIKEYTGPNPLVIEEDLVLGATQTMQFIQTDIVVPEGVTLTAYGFFSCHDLTVKGTMNVYASVTTSDQKPDSFSHDNPSKVIIDGALNLYGDDSAGFYYSASLAASYIYGDENIHRFGEGNMVYVIRAAENEDDIRKTIYEAQTDHKDWKEYCPSIYKDFTLKEDLSIPRNCSLDLWEGTFTVAEGAALTIYGGMELYGGKADIQGSLVNEGEIQVIREEGERIRLREDSCYAGDGLIDTRNDSLSTQFPGFDLSGFYMHYSGSRVIMTKSRAVYDGLEAGSDLPEEVYYEAAAPIAYHQTQARTMLEYVNDFRMGDEAGYKDPSGENVSLVGQLKPLEYSYSLEEIAMQRAAEIAVQFLFDHSRPNGQPWNSLMSSDGKYSNGENLSASTAPSVYSFYMSLREDDADYGGQGHRRNMLNKDFRYMGVGYTEYCGLGFLVQEFGTETGTGREKPAEDGTVVTVIEVAGSNVYRYDHVKPEPSALTLVPGDAADYPAVSAELFVVPSSISLKTDPPVCTVTPEWKTEDTRIAEIKDGKIAAAAAGETALTASVFDCEVRVPVVVSSSGMQKPRITEQPRNPAVSLGGDAVLHVGAEGKALSYQWYYRLKEGADWKEFPYESDSTGTLSFKARADYNNCDFRCAVSNAAGTVTSDTVHLSLGAELNKHSLLLPFFRTETLKLPQAEGTGEYIFWSSSDPEILTVTRDGTINPHKFGTAEVTASLGDGRITDSCKVSVVFSDVGNRSDYYFNHVYWAMDSGITNGYSSGTYAGRFGVGLSCTREDMMTFLWRMAGKPEPKTAVNPFSDVKSSAYYYKAVLWGVENGITNGYSSGPYAGRFGVGLDCTREHAMTFLWRLAGKPQPRSMSNPFKDVKSSDYFFRAVLWASENGIANGYSSGQYAGRYGVGLACLREHMVTFLSRYAARFGNH